MKSKLLLISIELFVFLAILIPSELLAALLKMSRPEGMAVAMLISLQFYNKLKVYLRKKLNA